ncbi:MAG: glycogen debranching enzyme, partial [Pseudonocardiales bacterium]
GGCKDLAWFHPAGHELSAGDWFDTGLRSIGMYLDGRGLRNRGARGQVIVDDSYLLVLHSGDNDGAFRLPGLPWATAYEVVIDTTHVGGVPDPATARRAAGVDVPIGARSSLLLLVKRD